jgi:formylglycine-generating enzyme required for sulfatase activity
MNRYALVVGINDYTDAENIRSLRFAVEDARQVDRFFHACGFEVQTLMDSEATCAAIEQQLRDLSSRLQPRDMFLFYFSGHAYLWGMPGEERQYLLPRDANLWAIKNGAGGRAIPIRLAQECSAERGASRVVIVDGCRSRIIPGDKGDAATEERLAAKDIQEVVAGSRTSSPLIVVCSCRPLQHSYEHGGLRGGLFTTSMLSEFDTLRNGGKSVAFTTEVNTAIRRRMHSLAAEIKLDATKVGDFWVEGDASGLELVPAGRPKRQEVVVAPRTAVDPEKVQVKEWAVEELHVEVERVEVVESTAPNDLPPIPPAILELRSELAGLEQAVAQLRENKHPSLKQAKDALRQAEAQLQTLEEDLAAHEVSLPREVRDKLVDAVATDSGARPSVFCDMAPQAAPTELLPFVARLRNVHRAQMALQAVQTDLNDAIVRKIGEIEERITASRQDLQRLQEEDLQSVLCGLWPTLRDADLMEVWSNLGPQLAARGSVCDSLTLLKKVEAFLAGPEEACREADQMMDQGLLDRAEIRVNSASVIYPGYTGLDSLRQEIARRVARSRSKKIVQRGVIVGGAILVILIAVLGISLAARSAKERRWQEVKAAIHSSIEGGNLLGAYEAIMTAEERFSDARNVTELSRVRKDVCGKLWASPPESIKLEWGGMKMTLVLVPSGSFRMGSSDGEEGRYSMEGPQHEVTVSRPFYMGAHEVTQTQYEAVVGTNPSHFKGSNNPVDCVSWNDAIEFCKAISNPDGVTIRLPTEAEWEYACRAGSSGRFCFGDPNSDLGEYAWYFGNAGSETHPVGQKKSNAWGLYDMHGNVWEWCADNWHVGYKDAPTDGSAWQGTNPFHVVRGGSWHSNPRHCCSPLRYALAPDSQFNYLGFRVVFSVDECNPPDWFDGWIREILESWSRSEEHS